MAIFWRTKKIRRYLVYNSIDYYLYLNRNEHLLYGDKDCHRRAVRRLNRKKWINRRWREWMGEHYAQGEFSKGFYLGRGCYCDRCVRDRTKWKYVERVTLTNALKEHEVDFHDYEDE